MATLTKLRKARRRSVSFKDISDQTKIGPTFLLALENDRWELMPQNFFLKGVIKAYAEAIGADPAVYLQKFELQKAAKEEAAEREQAARGWKRNEPQKKIKLESEKSSFGRGFGKFLLIAAALAAVAAVIFFS
jgi:cytoskeletal protein RodZ